MDIYKYLQKYNNLNKKSINYFDTSIEYYTVDYFVGTNQFLKYYIFDLIKTTEYKMLQWENKNEFSNFQAKLLEDEFFGYVGDERYNIYLIFVVADKDALFTKLDIRNDFQYARKIILQESEVEKFFSTLFPLQRKGGDNELIVGSFQQKEIKKELDTYAQKCFELLKMEMRVRFYISQTSKRKKNIEIIPMELISILGSCKNDSEKMIDSKNKRGKNSMLPITGGLSIDYICNLNVRKYRRFQENCKIPFKKVNLLFGDNGVGKTSILDAIELGITGYNPNNRTKILEDTDITIESLLKDGKRQKIAFNEGNYVLSEKWYGVQTESSEEFNKLFRQYNYFDTQCASSFAVEGEARERVKKLQKILGIDEFEESKKYILVFLKKLCELAEEDEQTLKKILQKSPKRNLLKKTLHHHYNINYIVDNKKVQEQCRINSSRIEEKFTPISWETIIKEHISKIESVFKLLVSTDEYTALKVKKEEIVAIRNNKEEVSMSKMSTGQRVCLALAFMFALFLSSETAPNVVLLDEPVANLDDIHMLNFMDLLRRLALSGTQIFFTTANPDVAKLFRRKFSYLEEDFGFYRIVESDDYVKIDYEQYSQSQEEPVKVFCIYGES